MAINKRKVLDAARKYAQKGAKQKALKEYNQLIALDPRDAKLLLEVGDAYRRWGQVEEAITQYTKVAAQYKQDGFDARAVAVYKQILNLDPKRYTAYVSLSELYQRMGLDGEAIGALQTAADGYHKEGRKREALELLRRMAGLDPSNTTSRMKVADLLKQEGMGQEAVAEYEEVIAEFRRQGSPEQAIPVYERILEIQPKRVDMLVALSEGLCESGRPELAEPFAKRAIEASEEPEHYELLCTIYRSLGNDERLAQATRNLAKLYRQRGDEDRAREIMQRLPAAAVIDEGGLGIDSRPDAEEAGADTGELADEELLDDEFLMADDGEQEYGGEEAEIELDEAISTDSGGGDAEAAAEESLPEGDPDQLFAEASVYLRYGKREQAIASLKAILIQEPSHRGALEKLGEAHSEAGDPDTAVGYWLRAAEAARSAGDSAAFGIVRDRIAALDPEAAAELQASESDGEAEADSLGIEIDLGAEDREIGGEGSDGAGEETSHASEPDHGDVEFDVDMDVEIDLGSEGASDSGSDSAEEVVFQEESASDDAAESSAEGASALAGGTFDIDVDTSEFEIDVEDVSSPDPAAGDEEGAASESSPSLAGQSTASAARIQEELEEADFYVQQGLVEEAEGVYRRILSVAPNHPVALLRLGELAAARGEDPSSGGLSIDDEDGGTTLEDNAPTRAGAEAPEETQPDADAGIDLAADLEQELASESDEDDSTEPGLAEEQLPGAASEESAAESARLSDDTLPIDARESEATFDLAAELADVFEDPSEEGSEAGVTGSVLSTLDDGFESIFADFKKGVSATLEEGDYETRYDLGIAYREMELFDDAIAEFRVCLDSPSRRFDSLYMMGLCAFDLGRHGDAVNHLEQALALGDISSDRQAGVYFDLGRAYESSGDPPRARDAYERVGDLAPGFPGLADRLAALAAHKGGSSASETESSDEQLESFGDLMADLSAEDGVEASESFESFDDVITEVEASRAASEAMVTELEPGEAEVVLAEDEPAPKGHDSEPAAKPGRPERKPPRKKRISFV